MVLAYPRRRSTVNSLQQLNNYSSTLLSYTDNRPYSITFSSNAAPVTQNIAVTEGDTHVAQSGINVTSVISTPADITFTIDLTSLPGAIVTWPTLPTGVTSSVPSANVYRVTGVNSANIWNAIKAPTITMPRDTGNNFNYTSGIEYPVYDSSSLKQWVTQVTVTDLPELSAATNVDYFGAYPQNIDGNPTILDAENTTGTYTMAIIPSATAAVTSIFTLGTGGSTSFNNSTRTLTIVGTRTQVNSHLNNLVLDPEDGYASNFNLTYSLTNPVSGLNTQVTQTLTFTGVGTPIINAELPRTYKENQQNLLFPTATPQVLEEFGYTYDIRMQLASNIGFISTSSTATGWTAGNLSFNFSGTNAQCNSMFGNLRFHPNQDTFTSSTINYLQKVGVTTQANVDFSLTGIEETNATITGGTTAKIFDSDVGAVTFEGALQIYPYWDSNVEINISATVDGSTINAGTFSATGYTFASNVLSATITKPLSTDAINANLANVQFLAGSNIITAFDMRQEVSINGTVVDTRVRPVSIQRDTTGTLTLRSDYNTASNIAEINAVFGSNVAPFADFPRAAALAGNTSVKAVTSGSSNTNFANIYTTSDNITFNLRFSQGATAQIPQPFIQPESIIFRPGWGFAAVGAFGSSAAQTFLCYATSNAGGTTWFAQAVPNVGFDPPGIGSPLVTDGTTLFLRADVAGDSPKTVDLVSLSGNTYSVVSITNNFRSQPNFSDRIISAIGVLNNVLVMFGYSQITSGGTTITYPTLMLKGAGSGWTDVTGDSAPGSTGESISGMAWDGTYYWACLSGAGTIRWFRSTNLNTWTLYFTGGSASGAGGILSWDGTCFITGSGDVSTNLRHFVQPPRTCVVLSVIDNDFYWQEIVYTPSNSPPRQYTVGLRYSIYQISNGTASFKIAVAEQSTASKARTDIRDQINANATALSLGWVATIVDNTVIIDTNDNASGTGTLTFTLLQDNGAPGVDIDGVNNTYTVTII